MSQEPEIDISVKKLTDEELMKEACESTFLGKSNQTLSSIYKSEHSPARTQLFWITIHGYYLSAIIHLIRHHVGIEKFQLSCRPDKNKNNPYDCSLISDRIADIIAIPEEYRSQEETTELYCLLDMLKNKSGRNQPTNLSILVNAQSLIDMAKLRLCSQAEEKTRVLFEAIKKKVAEVDPDLAALMVRKCVYRNGLCGEQRCCGFNATKVFQDELNDYKRLFSDRQKGTKE